VRWFQTDSDAPNDPKLKAIIRRGVEPNPNQAAAGATFLLWCYLANHGKGDPGLGIRADGTALPLSEMASECLFDGQAQLVKFLDYAAELGHVHAEVWQKRRVVFLPAMWERVSAYYRSKARKTNYETAQAVVEAVLAGTIKAQAGPERPAKALPDKPTKPTLPTDLEKIGDLDLLSEAGPDQIDAVVKLWNTERKPGPLVQKMTEGRREAIRLRLKDHPNLEDWRTVIRYINRQAWCNAPGFGEHAKFRMDLDTLLKPGKFQAALERCSLDKPQAAGEASGRDASRGKTGVVAGKFTQALAGGGE